MSVRDIACRGATVGGANIAIGRAERGPSRFLVEIAGFEPAASGLQSRRSPS
jgi:hypothetical protein